MKKRILILFIAILIILMTLYVAIEQHNESKNLVFLNKKCRHNLDGMGIVGNKSIAKKEKFAFLCNRMDICYFNVAIQTLMSIEKIRVDYLKKVFSKDRKISNLIQDIAKKYNTEDETCLFTYLKKFKEMKYFKTKNLADIRGNVIDFLQELLVSLADECRNEEASFFNTNFICTRKLHFECLKCKAKNSFIKKNLFLNTGLHSNTQEAIDLYFNQFKYNHYKCQYCSTKPSKELQNCIIFYPKYIFINNGQNLKKSFSEKELFTKKMVAQDYIKINETEYQIFGKIMRVFQEKRNRHHVFFWIKRDGKWYELDSKKIDLVTKNEEEHSLGRLYLYEKVD